MAFADAFSIGIGNFIVVGKFCCLLTIFKLDDFTGQNPSDRLTIGWAMTCANDTIINEVLLEELVTTDVPLPGGLPLFLSGLVGLGFLGRYRAKKRAETA